MANADGPNFASPAEGTVFPMLQTAIEQNAGFVPMVNLDNTATINAGDLEADVDGSTSTIADGSLDWTQSGYWNIPTDWFATTNAYGVFVAGYETPAASIPIAGTANFEGSAAGYAFTSPDGPKTLSGDALFTADFAARTLTGELTNMSADGVPWNNVAFTSTILGNGFSGTTSVTSAPSGASLGTNATGTLEGLFFGPSAQEAGAVWTLFDGLRSAIGTFTGRRQ